MTKQELQILIFKKEKEYEKGVNQRSLYTLIFFTAVYAALLYTIAAPISVSDWLGLSIGSAVLAFVHHIVNGAIYVALGERSRREKQCLEELKKKLQDMQ